MVLWECIETILRLKYPIAKSIIPKALNIHGEFATHHGKSTSFIKGIKFETYNIPNIRMIPDVNTRTPESLDSASKIFEKKAQRQEPVI